MGEDKGWDLLMKGFLFLVFSLVFFPLFSFLFFTTPTAGGECWWHVCLCLYDIGAIYGVDILKLHMSLACWVACLIENSLSSHL